MCCGTHRALLAWFVVRDTTALINRPALNTVDYFIVNVLHIKTFHSR
jgi:hypothetical protein